MMEIRIENTNHCGYKCMFCPREKMTREQGIMPVDDFILVLGRIKEFYGDYSQQIDLHGYGEPLLDKSLPEKVALARAAFPHAKLHLISTLGVKVGRAYLEALVNNGLDTMMVSLYASTKEEYKKITNTHNLEVVLENLHLIGELTKYQRKTIITVMYNIEGNIRLNGAAKQHCDFIANLCNNYYFFMHEYNSHNYGRGREYNTATKNSICSVVNGARKNIIQVTWDLSTIPCCFDFNAEMAFGDLRKSGFGEIFASTTYRDFIDKLSRCDYATLPSCQNCDRR